MQVERQRQTENERDAEIRSLDISKLEKEIDGSLWPFGVVCSTPRQLGDYNRIAPFLFATWMMRQVALSRRQLRRPELDERG